MNKAKHVTVQGNLIPLIAMFIATIGSLALQGQTPLVINSSDHRPLANALDALEIATGAAFNYEDPPYENQADLEDVSTPQQRASMPGYRLLVPRKGQISTNLQVEKPSSDADKMFYVNMLLSSYRGNKMPGDFKVDQTNGMVYVTPTKVLAANGAVRDVTSPMAAVITIPFAERRVIDTVAVILEAASKSAGVQIAVGSVPFLPTQTVGFGAAQEPARDALARLFAELTARPVSYRLLFDPLTAYMLNVQVLPEARSSPSAEAPAPTTPPAGAGSPPTENPFFVKTKP